MRSDKKLQTAGTKHTDHNAVSHDACPRSYFSAGSVGCSALVDSSAQKNSAVKTSAVKTSAVKNIVMAMRTRSKVEMLLKALFSALPSALRKLNLGRVQRFAVLAFLNVSVISKHTVHIAYTMATYFSVPTVTVPTVTVPTFPAGHLASD